MKGYCNIEKGKPVNVNMYKFCFGNNNNKLYKN